MNLFGLELGFLHPLLLFGGPLVLAGLVYAYLKRGRGQRVLVASTLLLELLQRTSSARKKFIPPLRFWLELLVLSMLVLAAAGLYRKDSGSRIALVVDNSFSMLATDLKDASARSRFAVAIEEAARTLDGLSSSSSVTVFSTSPALSALTDAPVSPSSARALLSGITASFAGDSLEAVLARLAPDERFDRIEAVTDRPAAPGDAHTSGKIRLRQISPAAPGQVIANLAVTDFHLEKNALRDGMLNAQASVAAYSDRPVRVTVALDLLSGDTSSWSKLKETVLDVPAHGSANATFEGLSAHTVAARLSIRSAGGAKENAIGEDDTGWITTSTEGEHLLLVSHFTPAELNLGELKSVAFDYMTPAQYSAEALRKLAPRAAIFHRVAPQTLPDTNSLFILPPPGNPILDVKPEQNSPQLTRWDDSHALLSYLNLSVLSLAKLAPLVPPAWAQVLVSTSAGPALVAGDLNGRRYAALGFDIFPYEGKHAPVVSILTLNAVKWLAELSVHEGYRPVYSTVQLDPEVQRAIRDDGSEMPRNAADPSRLVLDRPGLVYLRKASGVKIIAADFFNAEESDITRRVPVTLPAEVRRAGEAHPETPIAGHLAFLVLALAALDVLVGAVRLLRRKEAGA